MLTCDPPPPFSIIMSWILFTRHLLQTSAVQLGALSSMPSVSSHGQFRKQMTFIQLQRFRTLQLVFTTDNQAMPACISHHIVVIVYIVTGSLYNTNSLPPSPLNVTFVENNLQIFSLTGILVDSVHTQYCIQCM